MKNTLWTDELIDKLRNHIADDKCEVTYRGNHVFNIEYNNSYGWIVSYFDNIGQDQSVKLKDLTPRNFKINKSL